MSIAKHTETFRIHQPIDVLFPLFSAEGEKLWVPGWDYENIMGSTDLHEDYIFLTKNQDHSSKNAETIWLVKRYDPDTYFVQFYKVEPKEKVGLISVRCIQVAKDTTDIEVTYTYIGLSESGNRFVEGFTSTHYKEFIDEWERLLSDYFESVA